MNLDLTKLAVETELLLLTSRVKSEAFDLERAQALIHQNINWDIFVFLSKKHGTVRMKMYKGVMKFLS